MKSTSFYPMTGGLQLDTNRGKSLEEEPVVLDQRPEQIHIPLKHNYVEYQPCVVLGETINAGQAIASAIRGKIGQNIHSHYAGTITEINNSHIIIQTQEALSLQKGKPACNNFVEFLQLLGQQGITGLGCAEFPTHQKLSLKTHTLLINGVECEPLLTSDACLMTHLPESILQGVRILQQFLPVSRIIWAIEEDKPLAIQRVKEKVSATSGSKIDVLSIPSRYPAGGSRQLYEQVFGSRLGAKEHLLDRGVLCLNVQTIAAIAAATQGQPLTQRLVTITGTAVKNPINVWLAIGTPLHWILQQIQLEPGPHTIQYGGPLMGKVIRDQDHPITAGTSAIIIDLEQERAKETACIQCGYCNDPCPEALLPQALIRYAKTPLDQKEPLQQLHLTSCIECGACDLVCPSSIPLSTIFKSGKQEIRLDTEKKQRADQARQKYEARLARLSRPARANPLPPAPKRQEYKSTKSKAQLSKAQLKTALAKAQRLAREAVSALQQAEKKQLDETTLSSYRERVARMQAKAADAQKAYESSE